MKEISVALAADNTYAQHLGCTLASILLSSTEEESFSFFILDGGISQENKDKIKSLKNLKTFEITFLSPPMEKLRDCPSIAHFTINAYLRLLLPEMLPDRNRILYLDSDMIVTRPLSELWETNLEEKILGAVPDVLIQNIYSTHGTASFPFLTKYYFNSGMLLLDLQKIREGKWFEKTLEWIQKTSQIRYPDQDGLNMIFREDYKRLPDCWNIQILFLDDKSQNQRNHLLYHHLKTQKGIIHYIGNIKPWHYNYQHPIKSFYYNILKKTPWNNYRPPTPTLKERIRLFLRRNPANQKFRKWCKEIKLTLRGEKSRDA